MSRMVYDDFLLKVVGTRLRELREIYGLSAKEMSKMSCIDLDSYKQVEIGKRNASIGLLCNIAAGLKITPNEIFNNDYEKLLNRFQNEREIADFLKTHSFLISKKKVMNLLIKYRKCNKISQQNMAVLLDITRAHLNNLENGRGKISMEIIIGLMRLKNLNLENFFKLICIDSRVLKTI